MERIIDILIKEDCVRFYTYEGFYRTFQINAYRTFTGYMYYANEEIIEYGEDEIDYEQRLMTDSLDEVKKWVMELLDKIQFFI